MDNKWRPKDWKNSFQETAENSKEFFDWRIRAAYAEVYEAGADAIIKALRDKGVFTYGNHTPDVELRDAPEVSGHWCFIPDAE